MQQWTGSVGPTKRSDCLSEPPHTRIHFIFAEEMTVPVPHSIPMSKQV